jgi:Rps23 Pro-64 3,4-dihydroxylase Tpa1-like proline 4-hydroxylase
MKTEQECIEFLIKNCLGVEHGRDYYISHCLGVYTFLKQLSSPTEICLAGLFHSVYGNEFFNPELNLDRNIIKEYIGEQSEDLVHTFCTIENRDIAILKNTNNFDERKRKDLIFINYANLIDQSWSIGDIVLNNLITEYQKALSSDQQIDIGSGDKILQIYDELINNSDIDWLHTFCLNSSYKCEHSSSPLGYEKDSRFSSKMNNDEIKSSGVFQVVKKISELVGESLYIGNCYINHYQLMTSTARHTDSSFPNTFTVLIFCNKYWEESWGGELKIYQENSKIHQVVDYVPGRVIFFDSRIEHKVLPLTHSAKKDRFTIAVKCSNIGGLTNLSNMYGEANIIKVDNV